MEMFDLEKFPTSKSAKKMLSYVSDGFYDKSYVGKWIFQVMGNEYDKACEMVEELPKQLFPETATWGLMYHEIKWGLPIRANLSDEERRRLIYQKRDYRAPMTPYCMEKYLANTTGFEVHVSDVHDPWKEYLPEHPNQFRVFFLGEGTLNAKLALRTIERIKQSHTTFEASEYMDVKTWISILYHAKIRMVGECYPRYNLPYLCYDGSAKYDSTNRYQRYKSKNAIDLYPTALSIYGTINLHTLLGNSVLKLRGEAGTLQTICKISKIAYQTNIKPENRTNEIQIAIRTHTAVKLPTYKIQLTIGYHITKYDGTYRYDGSRKYDSEIIVDTL